MGDPRALPPDPYVVAPDPPRSCECWRPIPDRLYLHVWLCRRCGLLVVG